MDVLRNHKRNIPQHVLIYKTLQNKNSKMTILVFAFYFNIKLIRSIILYFFHSFNNNNGNNNNIR